jgi:hypothetical protein
LFQFGETLCFIQKKLTTFATRDEQPTARQELMLRVEAEENTQLCERVFLFYPTRSKFLVDH